MLQSIKHLYSKALRALDGEIGYVKDFYFDDTNWAVRYVVADTGSWIAGRQVLLAPHAFSTVHQDGKVLLVNLIRKQIENSPSIETHRPVSRQFEEEYYQYYGWPSYWMGDLMWGISDFLPLARHNGSFQDEKANAKGDCRGTADPNLRSTQAMRGYRIHASDGTIGHVSDFIVDDQSWAIRRLVAETGHWLSGKEVLISLNQIDGISYEESKIFVKLTKEAIRQEPEYYDPPLYAGDQGLESDANDSTLRNHQG